MISEWLVFMKVIDNKSISKTARDLGSSVSFVSKSIAKLENDFNCQFIRRNAHHFEVTEAGKIAYKKATEVYNLYDLLSTEIRNSRVSHGGDFVFIVPGIIGDEIASEWLWEYMSVNIGVGVKLNSIDGNNLFSDSPMFDDLVVKFDFIDSADLIHKKLNPIPFGIYASPTYLMKTSEISMPDDLNHHALLKFVHPAMSEPLSFRKKEVSIKCDIKSDKIFYSNNVNSIIHLALKGKGVGLGIPQWKADPYVKNGALIQLIPEWLFLNLPCYLVWRYRQNYSFSFKDFILYIEHKWNLFFNEIN